MKALLALLLISCVVSAHARVHTETMSLKLSEVERGNLLPSFKFLEGAEEGGSTSVHIGGGLGTKIPFQPADDCTDDIWEGANEDLRSPQLPYLTQSMWNCDRKETNVPVLVLETGGVKTQIVPQWGGKLWRVKDKLFEKELVFNNPAHQPANIGALKAWTSGGVEFNWSPGIIGHSAFTEAQVWAAKLATEKGDMIRVWEFDRYNATTYQVDILLDEADNVLWFHPKVSNPSPLDQRGYWWTCGAHHCTPKSRIIAPGTAVAETSASQMHYASWPFFTANVANTTGVPGAIDNSKLGNLLHGDYFIRIREPETPFIAHADDDGYTVVHGHQLNGTKFFTWGQNSTSIWTMRFHIPP